MDMAVELISPIFVLLYTQPNLSSLSCVSLCVEYSSLANAFTINRLARLS